MPRLLDPVEHMARKKATALDFTVRKNSKGEILNPEVVSKTSQSFKEECDVNNVIKRGIKNGFLLDPNQMREGRFGDFTNVPDYQTALNQVIRMKNEFNALPAEVRARFENDPAKVLAFVEDPKNEEEAVKLGLLPKANFETRKVETPNGTFWVYFKNGVETKREEIKPPVPAPGA